MEEKDNKDRLSRTDVAAIVHERTQVPKAAVESVLKELGDVIAERCFAGSRIALAGLGTFQVRDQAARTGINRFTGKEYSSPAKRVLRFRAASVQSRAVEEA